MEIISTRNGARFLHLMICLSLCFWTTTNIQGQKINKLIDMAKEAADAGNWGAAYSYGFAAYQLDSTSFQTRAALARAAFEIGDFESAEQLFEMNYAKDKGQIFPDALFYLAAAQKRLGQYEDAQRNFKTYLKKFKSKGQPYLVERADHEIKSAQWAMQFDSNDTTFKEPSRWDVLNSYQSEYPSQKIDTGWIVSKCDSMNQWRAVACSDNILQPIAVFTNDEISDIANVCLVDSTHVLFSGLVNGYTSLFEGSWNGVSISEVQLATALNAKNSNNTMAQMGLYMDQPCVYFVSDRKDGLGETDIWYSILENGRWQKPLNAGSHVNSLGKELTPHFSMNTLYFASDYRYGFGGMDIFSSDLINGVWQPAENLGDMINSPQDDIALMLDPSSNEYLYATAREQMACNDQLHFGCLDIWKGVYFSPPKAQSTEDELFFKSLEELNSALPVTLYFHNDEPNPKTTDTVSTVDYVKSYEDYLALIPKYVDENTRRWSGEIKEQQADLVIDFFDLQVKRGKADLDIFCALLHQELKSGHSVRIWIRGFASPRAQSDYNLNLTKRRTSSLIKYISELDNGKFMPYIEDKSSSGARLEFIQLPFGEVKAKQGVSDDLLDVEKSIYSRAACLERKIEIESVTIMPNTVKEPKLGAFIETHDFGLISKLQPVKHTFYLPNEGNAVMYIDSVIAECGCTTPELDNLVVLPGEKAQLQVTFDPFGKKGHATKTVTIFIRGMEPKRITLEAEIEK
jgi:Protein of unknown function (DUF1573)